MMDQPRARWFRSVNGDGRYGVALLLSVAALVLLGVWGTPGRELLQYQRDGIATGQWWRLVSAHGVHWGTQHLLFNLAGLGLLWAMLARHFKPRQWLLIALSTIAAIDLGLWFLQPAVAWYVGASGVLHGGWAAGGVAEWRWREPRSWPLLLVLISKLGYEQLTGASAVLAGMPVVLGAHVYGALGGALAAVVIMSCSPKPTKDVE
jgi:rhomboid family GlyGly-CTERM serine protease